jgi:hypothetical protein
LLIPQVGYEMTPTVVACGAFVEGGFDVLEGLILLVKPLFVIRSPSTPFIGQADPLDLPNRDRDIERGIQRSCDLRVIMIGCVELEANSLDSGLV